MLVAPHGRTAGDVYDQLLDALGIEMPADDREKPSCCDEAGAPPAGPNAAEAIAEAVERRAARAPRRR